MARDQIPSQSTRAAVESALNLSRIYKAVKAYPQISEVRDPARVKRSEVLAGYERLKRNRHLAGMLEKGEKDIRTEHAQVIDALCELVEEVFVNGHADGYRDGFEAGRARGWTEGQRDNESRYHGDLA